MESTIQDVLSIVKSPNMTVQQKLIGLGNTSERLFSPIELLGYTEEEMSYLNNQMICDLNEGYALYRPRYIVPDYGVFIEKGCEFLEIDPPKDLDECLDGLLILYTHVPSITSFPVFIGHLDRLMEPFMRDETEDYVKIKRFLNHIDKTITDSFCHADIGPYETTAGKLILKAVMELKNPTPNMTIRYDKDKTSRSFAELAAKSCLLVSKPSFSNDVSYNKDVGDHALCSCYNALPFAGGAYTLLRLRLGTIARAAASLEVLLKELLPEVAGHMLSMMDKRIKFIVEESNFFESSFLQEEGFIDKDNFTAMFAIIGLADAVNAMLIAEGLDETFGQSARGDIIGHQIMQLLEKLVNSHKGQYVERTGGHYLLHAQVGAALHEEDTMNTPAHRVKVGQEPILIDHLKHSAPFHQYFPSGTGDLFAFDQTYVDHPDAVVDIIDGAFSSGYRYITTYMKNTDLIRVTGYLVKKSEVEKLRKNQVVLRDTTVFGMGTDDNNQVFDRKLRQ
ncbi:MULTISPECIES: YjjI family glycine radical enzyme [unclassified Oceanispirochaeta]|uniref:YjjI family glycine radical enzyme n=1 Tax=unclassified Oceanispirochaeta TaxID=2635722 RepID=UPI000E0930D0|nr:MULTISPECIES: YjjI family glycine radical enzyme [unclassified Oceanispirochaeta]MBF9015126.1 YjjI family glycine radical enzyme [Oceanispirochaeta sp. M2]NPD71584.1 YjjI family glycine radical enzyme [Oceanispirochaeta sp. M1]RDG33151.1 YjjI family glycine radical enzyme [Oceanispirochaeta sp. M1]